MNPNILVNKNRTKEDLKKSLEYKLWEYLQREMSGDMTHEEFNEKSREIREHAIKNGIRCSGVKRKDGHDGRDDCTFYEDIYFSSKKEEKSIKEYFIEVLIRKGFLMECISTDNMPIGRPKLLADDKPDYIIQVGENEKRLIDSKVFNHESILTFKKNNIESYVKYNARMFVTSKNESIFFTPKGVRRLNKFMGEKKPMYYGKEWVYSGKECIEVSNRETRDITLEELKEGNMVEVWDKDVLNPTWIGPLKKFNKG